MANGKIDKVKLNQMLRSGKSQKDCAKFFSVTEGAISQVKKEMNINVVRSVALENAHRVVNKNLNAIDQLHNINQRALDLLDKATDAEDHSIALKAMAEIRGQLNLQLDIFKTMYDLEAVSEFQREVIEIIGEVDRETRDRFVQRLKQRQALRGSVEIR